MNFLAHAYLSFGQEKILVGNFIADFVKGKQIDTYELPIRRGIYLHREIDRFTDRHPLVKAGQSYLRDTFGHYATVITDIFFDYFLVKAWDHFTDIPLDDFISDVYKTLDRHESDFPSTFAKMYYWMKKDNWLLRYGTVAGVRQTLTGLSKRTSFHSNMELAHLALKEREAEFEVIFFAFFTELESFAQEKLIEIEEKI